MVQSRVSIASRKDLIRFLLSRGLEEEGVLKLLGPGTKVSLEEAMDMGPAALEKITGITGKRFKRAFAWVDLEEKPKKIDDETGVSSKLRGSVRSDDDEPKETGKKEKPKKVNDESGDSSNPRGSVRSDADEPKETGKKEKGLK